MKSCEDDDRSDRHRRCGKIKLFFSTCLTETCNCFLLENRTHVPFHETPHYSFRHFAKCFSNSNHEVGISRMSNAKQNWKCQKYQFTLWYDKRTTQISSSLDKMNFLQKFEKWKWRKRWQYGIFCAQMEDEFIICIIFASCSSCGSLASSAVQPNLPLNIMELRCHFLSEWHISSNVTACLNYNHGTLLEKIISFIQKNGTIFNLIIPPGRNYKQLKIKSISLPFSEKVRNLSIADSKSLPCHNNSSPLEWPRKNPHRLEGNTNNKTCWKAQERGTCCKSSQKTVTGNLLDKSGSLSNCFCYLAFIYFISLWHYIVVSVTKIKKKLRISRYTSKTPNLNWLLTASILLSNTYHCQSLQLETTTNIGEFMYGDMSFQITGQRRISVGLILPHSVFAHRSYRQSINRALKNFPSGFGSYEFQFEDVKQEMFKLTPSPKAILDTLCDKFLPQNVSAILYVTKDENYGRNTASSQYFLQLAGYLGIPVIAWNADNSGLEQASQTGLILQLAPSIHHQAHAMLSILVQYQWHAFTVITTRIAGHNDFIESILEKVNQFSDPTDTSTQNFKFTIIDAITMEDFNKDLKLVQDSEARILLLYSTREEGEKIMLAAESLGLTGKNYVWIVAQSIIGENLEGRTIFPVGMLGVHFDTHKEAMYSAIEKTINTFGYGVESFLVDPRNAHFNLIPNISCQGDVGAKWESGIHFYRYLNNVSIRYSSFIEDQDQKGERPNVRFDADGNREDVELKIMNLRDTTGGHDRVWEEIGTWRSWETEGLNVNDIVWPGNKHVPPPGVPEKFHLRITFMDEPPYISLTPPDSTTGLCNANSGVTCYVSSKFPPPGSMNITTKNNETQHYMCCSGFCIDLLKKFSVDLGFTYHLLQVEDKKWGTIEGTKWNGLVNDLLNQKADMALSSFKINSDRESVVDFTVPFLESGISIVVAKRTGIISPTAFLEPFDTASWMLVAFVAIQVAAFTIFIFEWLSPEGYNMKVAPPRDHKFSLLRTYWLVWAVLFQAAVHVDCPKGFTARFMANIWAMFAVVFLAIYTANLAAFMITREEYHDLSGVADKRLVNPFMSKPAFKFGTVPYTNSDQVFAKHLPEMYSYMNQYNQSHPLVGIQATKKGLLDAFIYDATVLNYLVGQDEECKLLTVGAWYHMTGYGVAFPRGSKHTSNFNKRLMEYKTNGDIERLQKFWLHGACRPKKNYKRASEPLALEQFLSAYLLLVVGVVLALLLLLLEHVYFQYLRKHLAKKDSGGCCALISLSMGKSLTFRGAVYEATDKLRRHRCRDPLCQTHIYRVKYELDKARIKIRQLEKELESHGVKPSKKFATRGSSSVSLLNACWRPPDDDDIIPESQQPIPNVFSSLSSARGSSAGCDFPLTTSTSSNPNTPTPSTTRELLAIRDMTKNHISTNEGTRRGLYIQTSGALLSHQSSDTSHLTALSPTDIGPPQGMHSQRVMSATSLVYHDNDDAYLGPDDAENYQASGLARHRSSIGDMREVAEMETVL